MNTTVFPRNSVGDFCNINAHKHTWSTSSIVSYLQISSRSFHSYFSFGEMVSVI